MIVHIVSSSGERFKLLTAPRHNQADVGSRSNIRTIDALY